ncbi:MAG: polysaccharide pyruvyl transferase CsaB [Clostridia bacterium]|nr:polysaccharide pyruvyl transferase CsaB [Clostridia bacterium]
MKVLLVTMAMGIGGAETHILELARGLKRRGVEVEVASAGGVYADALVREGVRHITLPLDHRSFRDMMRAERGLERLIRDGGYDIVHAHARIPAFLCGRIRRRLHFRFLTTDHLDFKLTPLLRRMTDWGEHTFAVSEDLRRYLTENFHMTPDRISLTVNGVDTARFSPDTDGSAVRAALDTEGRAVILHISRLDAPVCVCANALIDAMPLLGGRATLVLVGDGDARGAVQERADGVNAALGYRAVTLVGAQTDVRSYIAASDIVVAPSRAAMEGMASGKPTIISGSQGHGGIFSEAIAEEAIRSNLCFRGASLPTPEVLARELLTLLDMDASARAAHGMACRAFIEAHFSVDRMVESQLAVYERFAPLRTGGTPDVMICGYYGYGNSGDEAILSVTVRELRRLIPDVRITVLSARPEETAARYTVDAVNRFDLVAIRRLMKKTGLFLFGGGSLLQDKTSTRSLLYYTTLLRMAKRHGMKVIVYANGVGPTRRKENMPRVSEALRCADAVTLRDRLSLDVCRKMSLPCEPRLTFDPAILLEKGTASAPESPYFVVIPKYLGDYCRAKTVEWILAMTEKTWGRCVIVTLYGAQDDAYAHSLAAETGAVCLTVQDGSEAIALLASSFFVLSSRLHGLVYATVAGVPMLALTDDEKLISYMERIGLPDYFFLPPFADEMIGMFDEIGLRYDTICNKIKYALPSFRQEALQNIEYVAKTILSLRASRP